MKAKSKLLFVLSVIFFLPAGPASAIKVAPGGFDHFALILPEKITAGEGVAIKIQAQDAYNNLIANFSETGREFKAAVSGSASVQSSNLPSKSFAGGIANITITARKAEKIVFYIYEKDETVPVLMKELSVSPGKLDHFLVLAPDNVPAGGKFEVKIIAKDAFDNVISDVETMAKNISAEPVGAADIKLSGSIASDFKNGIASFQLEAEKPGSLSIGVKDVLTGSKGQSKEIIVTPASAAKGREPVRPLTVAEAPKETQKKPAPKAAQTPSPPAAKLPPEKATKPKSAMKTPEPPKKIIEHQATASVQPRKEIKKEEPTRPEPPKSEQIFTISDVSFLESEGRVLLVISGSPSSGAAAYKYKSAIEKKQGGEWLRIRLSPAARKTDKSLRLKSEMIGEVMFEEDGKERDTVNIYIELKARKPFFDISEQKNALVVMFSKTKF